MIHVSGSVDPLRDIEVINTELMLADMESLARQTSESLTQSVATFDDMVSGRLAERTRAEARKAYEEAMRNR